MTKAVIATSFYEAFGETTKTGSIQDEVKVVHWVVWAVITIVVTATIWTVISKWSRTQETSGSARLSPSAARGESQARRGNDEPSAVLQRVLEEQGSEVNLSACILQVRNPWNEFGRHIRQHRAQMGQISMSIQEIASIYKPRRPELDIAQDDENQETDRETYGNVSKVGHGVIGRQSRTQFIEHKGPTKRQGISINWNKHGAIGRHKGIGTINIKQTKNMRIENPAVRVTEKMSMALLAQMVKQRFLHSHKMKRQSRSRSRTRRPPTGDGECRAPRHEKQRHRRGGGGTESVEYPPQQGRSWNPLRQCGRGPSRL